MEEPSSARRESCRSSRWRCAAQLTTAGAVSDRKPATIPIPKAASAKARSEDIGTIYIVQLLSQGIIALILQDSQFGHNPAGHPNRTWRQGSLAARFKNAWESQERPGKSIMRYGSLWQCQQPPHDHRRFWRIDMGNGRLVLCIGV